MQCPNCDGTLQMAEQQGVAMNQCPQCSGAWLESEELEKMTDRLATGSTGSPGSPTEYEGRGYGRPPHEEGERGKH